MKKINTWQKSLALTASLSLFAAVFPAFSTAAKTEIAQNSQPAGNSQPAPTGAKCRRVATPGGINVRSTPNGTITGSLANGTTVTVEATFSPGWVTISAPQKGVIFDRYLTTCDRAASPSAAASPAPSAAASPAPSPAPSAAPSPAPSAAAAPAPSAKPNPTSMTGDTCRQVVATDGLNIRQSASASSPIVGSVANMQRVTIVNRGSKGWVPISAPVNGYVAVNYLKYCR